jgi:hypothetical protein
MLNTIATVRKQSYIIDGKEIILKPERLRTILYGHKAKLSNEKNSSNNENKYPLSIKICQGG